MTPSILHRDDLPLGGFAGLREHRLVMSPKLFGQHVNPGTFPGIGNFVYLADARFNPKGETRMHDHHEVDVVSVMIEGRIAHEGSLGHGQELVAYDVQVQRAGAEGFSHNEVNPDDSKNRMIQIWVLPEKPGECAAYKLYKLENGAVARVYGGSKKQTSTFPSHTTVEVALLNGEQQVEFEDTSVVYITQGQGVINDNVNATDGDLITGNHFNFKAGSDVHLIVVQHKN